LNAKALEPTKSCHPLVYTPLGPTRPTTGPGAETCLDNK
jgi:hypothetical protein